LTVFILGFQPLVRRVGAHANLWFLGWTFLLINELMVSFGTGPWSAKWLQLVAASSLSLCGLCFMAAAAEAAAVPGAPGLAERQVDPLLHLEVALPVLVQTTLCVLQVHNWPLAVLNAILFLLPLGHMLIERERRRPLVGLGIVLAGFGVVTLFFAVHAPEGVLNALMCLVFSSSGALYWANTPRLRRGGWAAIVGLFVTAASYPLRLFFAHHFPEWQIDRVLFQLPQYLVVAGVSLTLLEEHVLRTERMANHDPLTDLPNRRMFEEHLIATMEEARINRTTVACLVIDVDNFKTINDTLGHSAGDQLLRALAIRLGWHMSPRDILARTGGDEFTALLAGVTDEHHLRFIASAMMSAASVPIQIDSGSVDVHISVGIALSPDDADDIDGLRRAADQAMYSAKRRGGSLLAFAGEE
jgi:diguanylate cyclase (GGDEF)-like protein